MSASSEMNYAVKMGMLEHMRAAARLNSRVNVEVEWTENGGTHRADGYTMDISPKGCMAIVPQGFVVGQKMRLRNCRTHKETDAKLIWRGHEGRKGWELGLELLDPPMDFWGVEF